MLSNPDFAKKYHAKKLPDQKFTKLFLDVLYTVDVAKIKKLYDFVIKTVGGYDISTFKVKSKLGKKSDN